MNYEIDSLLVIIFTIWFLTWLLAIFRDGISFWLKLASGVVWLFFSLVWYDHLQTGVMQLLAFDSGWFYAWQSWLLPLLGWFLLIGWPLMLLATFYSPLAEMARARMRLMVIASLAWVIWNYMARFYPIF